MPASDFASQSPCAFPADERSLKNLPAPAKLNLFLHVTGRRADGMHLLESVFILIDLADTIDIERTDNGLITRTGDVVGDSENDLCVRAARALQKKTGTTQGARIRVTKRIPSGAGMGGGSSDCATTLMALNVLWDLKLSEQELIDLAATLGADVPFFIFGQSAFVRGIGEKMEPLAVPDAYWAIAMPSTSTSTAAVFSASDLTRNTKSLKISVFSDHLQKDWPALPGTNDLEPVARRINPDIARALRALSQQGAAARMTGSGSAVFAHAETLDHARALLSTLPEDMTGYVARTLQIHPLRKMLAAL